MKSFSYIPDASFSVEFFLHSSMLVLVKSFSYIPDASFSVEFFLHSSSWF